MEPIIGSFDVLASNVQPKRGLDVLSAHVTPTPSGWESARHFCSASAPLLRAHTEGLIGISDTLTDNIGPRRHTHYSCIFTLVYLCFYNN